MAKKLRLDKYICDSTGCTRSEAKNLIRKGQVWVGDCTVKKPEQKIDPETEEIFLSGEKLNYTGRRYYMLNKPQGVVTAVTDRHERTVMDLLDVPVRNLAPVGRLDKDTEGLLLITDDGELAHRLLSPRKHVEKCYYALLDGPIGDRETEAFRQGLDIGDEKLTMPARLSPANSDRTEAGEESVKSAGKVLAEVRTDHRISGSEEGFPVYITIQEGRFHQVKRMARAVGRQVLFLKRVSMGSLMLDERLAPGQFRELTEEELRALDITKRN